MNVDQQLFYMCEINPQKIDYFTITISGYYGSTLLYAGNNVVTHTNDIAFNITGNIILHLLFVKKPIKKKKNTAKFRYTGTGRTLF